MALFNFSRRANHFAKVANAGELATESHTDAHGDEKAKRQSEGQPDLPPSLLEEQKCLWSPLTTRMGARTSRAAQPNWRCSVNLFRVKSQDSRMGMVIQSVAVAP